MAALDDSDAVLVVIGPEWLPALEARRGDQRDWVRYEIAESLRRPHLPVVPICRAGVSMPQASQLPEEIAELAWRDGIELDPFSDFDAHVSRLLVDLERVISQRGETRPTREEAAVKQAQKDFSSPQKKKRAPSRPKGPGPSHKEAVADQAQRPSERTQAAAPAEPVQWETERSLEEAVTDQVQRPLEPSHEAVIAESAHQRLEPSHQEVGAKQPQGPLEVFSQHLPPSRSASDASSGSRLSAGLTTVEEFSVQLGRSTEATLNLLAFAGVVKQSGADTLTADDLQRALKYLRR